MSVHDTRPVITLLFIAKHTGVLALLLITAACAWTLALGSREGVALRSALGLALLGQAMFFLAAIGQLRTVPIIAVTLVAIAFMWRRRPRRRTSETPPRAAAPHVHLLVFTPLFVLALYPPIAFDETLYHLPFVRAFARDGALRFLADLRFPVFPQIHELLCVPVYLLAG